MRKYFVLLIITLFFLFFFASSKDVCALETANPSAIPAAKQLLNYLNDLPIKSNNRVISGQNFGNQPDRYTSFIDGLHNLTGKWPAMIGADYGHGISNYDGPMTLAEILSLNSNYLIPYWNNHGLITIYYPIINPWTNGPDHDLTRDGTNNLSSNDLDNLVTSGTSVNTNWNKILDNAAAGLADLQSHGVVVLWRPFHEMTYGDSWWGRNSWGYPNNLQPDKFKKIWRYMFDYFTNIKHLNNLLWVYSVADTGNPNRNPALPASLVYPGSDYVDIVGADVYNDTMTMEGDNTAYTNLINLGKPFALTESGRGSWDNGNWDNTITINKIRSNYPKTAYFLQWGSWTNVKMAIVDLPNATALLNDSWVITRDEVPDFSDFSSNSLTPVPSSTPILSPSLTPTTCPLKSSGDFNCDNLINESDLNTLLGRWTTSAVVPTQYQFIDLTGDGKVNESDLNKLLGNWKT